MTHFRNTHRRDPEGRHVVSLPHREPPLHLGKSMEVVLKWCLSNEKSLKRNQQWNSLFRGVEEYLEMGHAEKVLFMKFLSHLKWYSARCC